jgi:hypothetical protein
MSEFKKYIRTNIAELRPVTPLEASQGASMLGAKGIFISSADKVKMSPRIGDMIARNPENRNDQWLVDEKYFNENFKLMEE